MIEVGEKAPDFSLPGIHSGEPEYYDLHRYLGDGTVAVLCFYPVDWVPTVTPTLQRLGAWQERSDLVVWGISADSLFSHEAYADHHDITVPLLTDRHATIADGYDLVLSDFRGHAGVPGFGLVAIDEEWTVHHAVGPADPMTEPGREILAGLAGSLGELCDPAPGCLRADEDFR